MKLLIKPLRKALTPLSSPTPPSPPPNPCPWLWRCHSCYTIYRLAVTRRCLDCDHTFCLGEAGGAPPKGKKRKRGGPCKAEFDYTGWKARGSWRRTVLLNGATTSLNTTLAATGYNETNWGDEHTAATQSRGGEDEARFEDKRERLFIRRRHNCFIHCDFPSECHHSLFRAQQDGRPILRAAEALDAAEEEAARVVAEVEREKAKEGGSRQWARRLTVQEYKQRRAERQGRKLVAAAAAARLGGDLSTVDEEDDDDVSPCSPTFDGSGDLVREVSPVENEPLSPSDRSPSRASLLVTTDTPVDFATTAAPLSFDDDTYSGDDEGDENTEDDRRTKSRRKIAQLTGEGPESFGPFVLSGPSPTSPSAARPGNNLTALDLQAAWSEQAWFSSSSSTLEQQQQPQSPKSPERVGKRDRMFALLGRRGSGSPASPTRPSHDVFNMPAPQPAQESHHQHQAQHADATAVAGEEWESWSESSSSSSTSTSSGVSLLSSSSIEGGRDTHGAAVDDTDADEDVTMHEDEDDDDDSPVTPEGEHGTGPSGDETDSLRALLRMRNAFMRGEMM